MLDARLAPRVMAIVARLPLLGGGPGDSLQPLRDLDQIRSFVASGGPTAFFDLPWIPLYVVICWAFHPAIGVAVIIGASILFSLALFTEMATRSPTKEAAKAGSARMGLAESARRNAEVVHALGMASSLRAQWEERNTAYSKAQLRASSIGATLSGTSKVLRMAFQSGILALGAWLVIHQEATGGIIIAASILSARALAPVELAIANWKGFVAMRMSRGRLTELLQRLPTTTGERPCPRRAISWMCRP